MPKITFKEVDNTSPGAVISTTNAVYIPGYATTGPIDGPHYVESLDEFYNLYGNSPYLWEEDQPYPEGFDSKAIPKDKKFAYKGTEEKSFLYAAELLRSGLPVYFERVFDTTKISTFEASAKIVDATSGGDAATRVQLQACYPGRDTSSIYYTLTHNENPDYYELSVGRYENEEIGTKAIAPTTTRFTYSRAVSTGESKAIYYADLDGQSDNSGLVTINFVSDPDGTLKVTPPDEAVRLTLPDGAKSTIEFSVTDMYTSLREDPNGVEGEAQNLFNKLTDKGEYILKYITSGAYPLFEYKENGLFNSIIDIASSRGDVTALIDHTANNDRSLTGDNSVFVAYQNAIVSLAVATDNAGSYASMYTPWGLYTMPTISKQLEMPASFGYLMAVASEVQTYGNNWLAVAGATRGVVPGLQRLSQNVTNAIAESFEPRNDVSINPITNIKPYGYLIWGNRTSRNNRTAGDLTASSFMNVRQLVSDVKRQLFVTAKKLTFEQNSDILWINFKSEITPLLDQMVGANGLFDYSIKKLKTDKKATIKARITLYVVEAVEDWEFEIELADQTVVVSE